MCSSRGAPSMEEVRAWRRGGQYFPVVPSSAELVVVGLQQGLGDVTLLAAGQVLAGALLLRLAAATAAARQIAIILGAERPGNGQSRRVRLSFNQAAHREPDPTHPLSPVRLNLLLEEGADLLEGGSARWLQGPAGLHDAVSETGEEAAAYGPGSRHVRVHTRTYMRIHTSAWQRS